MRRLVGHRHRWTLITRSRLTRFCACDAIEWRKREPMDRQRFRMAIRTTQISNWNYFRSLWTILEHKVMLLCCQRLYRTIRTEDFVCSRIYGLSSLIAHGLIRKLWNYGGKKRERILKNFISPSLLWLETLIFLRLAPHRTNLRYCWIWNLPAEPLDLSGRPKWLCTTAEEEMEENL